MRLTVSDPRVEARMILECCLFCCLFTWGISRFGVVAFLLLSSFVVTQEKIVSSWLSRILLAFSGLSSWAAGIKEVERRRAWRWSTVSYVVNLESSLSSSC